MNHDITKFVARLPDDLHEEIKETARQNNRSMNGEIIHRLRQPAEAAVSQITLHVDTKEASLNLEKLLADLKAVNFNGQVQPGRA
ncbi:Arc family DNA-binding protein [Pseudomonas stutzeri]|uniref:Arc family DNA-binding protein n=1 Tax=Stutzerimonas stutzeri TaxID=316 RepID=UPI002109364A|nr:Arc family DNA-binding protein [Stutzerimonas stutzeri]MCQ4311734.1 Arc family DNA-binding protein [Stutzerimonas stutzeri]